MITYTEQKRWRFAAIVLLIVTGLSALAAGYGFIADPSGKGLGLSADYIRHSPFRSFMVPGLVLAAANGVLSIIIAIAALGRIPHYPALIMLQGLILTGWIAIQVAMVRDFNGLHLACLIIGIMLMVAGSKIRTAAT